MVVNAANLIKLGYAKCVSLIYSNTIHNHPFRFQRADCFCSKLLHKCKEQYIQWVFTCSKSTMKTLEQDCDLFKVNKKRHQNDLFDMKTLRNIDITLVSLFLTLKRFHIFSKYFILEFREVLPAWITSRDQGNNYKICKDRSKLHHINQMG